MTEDSIRLVDNETENLAAEWKEPTGAALSLAAANSVQVLVSTAGGRLYLLEVVDKALVVTRFVAPR